MFGSNFFAQSYFGQGYPLASIDWVVTATITGTSSATAIILDTESLVSSITGASSLAVSLIDYTAITSTIAGSSSMRVSITDADFIVANLSGSSSMSSAISDEEFIQGLFTGTSSATATISDTEILSVSISGSSSMTAIVDIPFIVSISGGSSMTATLKDTDNLTVAITGSSLFNATLFNNNNQPLSVQQIYDILNPDWWSYSLNAWNTGYISTQINYKNNTVINYLSTQPIQNYGINEGNTGIDIPLQVDSLRLAAAQALADLHCTEILGYTNLNGNQVAGAQQ